MNSNFHVNWTYFLLGAFAALCVHNLFSYTSRRRKPITLIFFVWLAFLISISIRLYGLYASKEMVFLSFALHIIEMGIVIMMLSHLAYRNAGKFFKRTLSIVVTIIILYSIFPDQEKLIYGIAQLMSFSFMCYLLYDFYLLKTPYYGLIVACFFFAALTFIFFGSGPLSIVSYDPVLAKILLISCFLISINIYSAYLSRVAALTNKKLVETEFITAKLKELDNLKTKFFSNITHEFRTPLTLIQGPANELLEKTNDPEAKKLLTMIKNNSARLLTLINQLLDLARLDAHEVKINLKAVRLDVLLKTTISQFTSLASSRLIHFEWRIPTEAHTVLMDEEKVETILINLISNALKFTPARGIVLVSATYINQTLEVEVKDNGRGIPSEKLAHIFDRFYQVEATDSSHSEGTGIGLALVKEYVELMKGTIQIESQVGTGTSIKIALNLVDAPETITHASDTPIEHESQLEEQLTAADDGLPLLLIVEDNEDIRSFIKTCLGNLYRYSEARHGREGLDKAQHEIPDIIISDLMMPEMDGLELCREIKKDVRTNHIPFIMLTAKAADENKMEGLQTGADDYLIKPFNKAELALKVHNLVLLREKLQAHLKGTLLSQATPAVATSANELFVAKAKAFIEAHMKDETLSVETLAAELNLGREQCYRKINALTGFSPSVFIRKLRIQKADQLLAAKWGPISQVAYEVGFENPSYFGRAFKEEFGKSPSDYVG